MLHFNKLELNVYLYVAARRAQGIFFPAAVKAAVTVETRP